MNGCCGHSLACSHAGGAWLRSAVVSHGSQGALSWEESDGTASSLSRPAGKAAAARHAEQKQFDVWECGPVSS